MMTYQARQLMPKGQAEAQTFWHPQRIGMFLKKKRKEGRKEDGGRGSIYRRGESGSKGAAARLWPTSD